MRRPGLIYLATIVAVVVTATLGATAFAQQDARFSVDFQGTNLSTALEILKRYDRDFSYTLPSNLENRTITASLVDVTLDEALGIMLDQVGLTFVKDNNVYKVREKQQREGGRAERPMPSYGSPVYTTRPTSPGQTAGASAATAARGPSDEMAEQEERAAIPPRMIRVQYGDPALLAELFGGWAIYGGEAGGTGGGVGGSSRGGYGSSNNTSSRGSFGSSRNTSSRGSFGSNNRSSGIGGSSRSSSSRYR